MNDTKRNGAAEDGFYKTGAVSEPRSRGSWLLVLLVLVVVLAGIVTILGILNIRLFHALQQDDSNAVQLQDTNPDLSKTTQPNGNPNFSMDLQTKPAENAEGMTPQEMYTSCKNAMVSVSCGTAEGIGVVLSAEGYILTSYTAVHPGQAVTVELFNGQSLSAQVVGTDPMMDLAVIYVQGAALEVPTFGDSDTLEVGDMVCTLGTRPSGSLTNTTVSHMSADRIYTKDLWSYCGPLLDRYGQVIGINVAGSKFSIPISTVKDIAQELINQGYVSGRPGLGIRWELVPQLHQNYYGLPAGLYVTQVEGESQLAVGDILVGLNGWNVTSEEDLLTVLSICKVGDEAELEVYRDGEIFTVTVTLEEAKG